ncbi:hypothetical protein QBC39DRAFT_342245 [Podospora conica]|nr:hypothetical protein QBC39DRAFT_342245 [Schizothecium conicum]
MNYSSMIEEKRLKQGFILATLISTIAGTFTTGINLYDRIVEKRKQAKLDKGQDERLNELEERYDKHHGGRSSSTSHRDPSPDLRHSLASGPPAIQREYDTHLSQFGPRFAEGDVQSQLQLQSQIITLQSTVIAVLESALRTGRPPDLSRLYNASEFAREGAVRALREQYRRMLEPAAPPSRSRPGMLRRVSSTPETLRIHAPGGVSKDGPLFCAVAVAVQRTPPGVALGEVLGGEPGRCPGCGAGLAAACRPWRIEAEVTMRREQGGEVVEVVEVRTYQVGARFLVKCHREGAGFSCFLCRCHRERDTVCEDVPTLVRHLVERHEVGEYLGDGDIREVEGVRRRERSVSVVGEGRRGRSVGRG